MEFSEFPDQAQEALLNFVRALARRRARIDAAEENKKLKPMPLARRGGEESNQPESLTLPV